MVSIVAFNLHNIPMKWETANREYEIAEGPLEVLRLKILTLLNYTLDFKKYSAFYAVCK